MDLRSSEPPELLAIGKVAGTHGLRGALKIRLYNSGSAVLNELQRCFLEDDGGIREFGLRQVSAAGSGTLRVMLDGVATIERAEALRGRELFAARADLPPLAEREFYYNDMLGFAVETTDGRTLGRVEEIFFNGANDVWVVRGNGAEVLLPVIADVVKTIESERRRAVVEPIPGLLD